MKVVIGNSLATSQKLKNSITVLSSNCISGYIPRRIETWVSKAYLYTHLHSSNVHNSQKMEETQVSINRFCSLVAWLCPTLCDPMDCTHQAPLSMEFSRQEYWSGLPCPPAGDLPNPGIKPTSHALQADAVPSELQGSPRIVEWVAYPFSSRSSQSKNRTWVSCIAGGLFICWATREAQTTWLYDLKRRKILFTKSKCEHVHSE